MTGLPVNHVEETKRISDGIITLQKPSTAQFVCIAVSVKVHSSTHSRCIVCDTDVWKKILAFVRGEQRNTLLCCFHRNEAACKDTMHAENGDYAVDCIDYGRESRIGMWKHHANLGARFIP